MLSEMMYFMASYAGLFLAIFLWLNWVSKGFFWAFLRVKGSRGKKLLTEVNSSTDVYFTVGSIVGKEFHYKTRSKNKRMLSIENLKAHPVMGVFRVCVDEVRDVFVNKDGTELVGLDTETGSSMVERALMAPKRDDLMLKIAAIAAGLGFIAACGAVWLGFSILQRLNEMQLQGVIV